MNVPALASWAVEALIASTLLMAGVLAIRGAVRRAFGAPVAYALWALPLLRMLLPPLPSQWREASVAGAIGADTIGRAGETVSYYVTAPLTRATSASIAAAPAHMAAPDMSLEQALVSGLALLWCAGAAAFLLWHATSHFRFVRRLLADPGHEQAVDGVQVIESAAAAGPLAFGVWRKYVAFPLDFDERYDADERDLALAHELGHHARGDLLANWAALVMLALHWFNPIAWRAFRAFRADQEMANDAAVLAGRSPVQRHIYACAIVKSAHGGSLSAACHLHTIHDLKGRLRMLSTTPNSRARLVTGVIAVGSLTLAGLGLTASGTQAAERLRTRIERSTGVTLAAPALPSLPAVAAAPALPSLPAVAAAPALPSLPAVPAASALPAQTAPLAPGEAPAPPAPPAPPAAPSIGRTDASPPMTDADIAAIVGRAPTVRTGNCAGREGGPDQMVVHTSEAGKPLLLVCNDRVDRIVARANAQAARASAQAARADAQAARAATIDTVAFERNAYRSALDGIRSSRAALLANPEMPDAMRAQALAAIDIAIAELERQSARRD